MLRTRKINIYLNGVILTLLIPTIIGIVVFVFIFDYKDDYKLRDIFFFATGSVAILTFIHHIINGKKKLEIEEKKNEDAKKYQDEMIRLSKEKNSYEIISQYYKPEMVESLRAFREIKSNVPGIVENSDIQELKKYLENNPKDHSRLHLLLNSFENVALQIKNGFVEEYIIKDALHSMFYNTHKTLKAYIKDVQLKKGYEKCWEDFVNLNKEWGDSK